jgi:signal transduction histidine kinase
MKTILQVQLEKKNLDPAVRRDTEQVLAETERLSQKLNELLRYAKPVAAPPLTAITAHTFARLAVEDASPSSAPRPGQAIEAATVAAQVVALRSRDSQARTVDIEFLPAPRTEELMICGPEESFREILANLIENGVEAQSHGGTVRIEMERRGTNLELRVTDAGPGVPPTARAKIFQPFFTTKASGTGLGLAIVAKRLEEMSGSIECVTPVENGRGTQFIVTLPLAEK